MKILYKIKEFIVILKLRKMCKGKTDEEIINLVFPAYIDMIVKEEIFDYLNNSLNNK